MLSTEQRIQELAEKWLSGLSNAEEEKELFDWYNANQDKETTVSANFAEGEQALQARILEAVQVRISKSPTPASHISYSHRSINKNWLRYAAAAFIIFVAGTYWWTSQKKPSAPPVAVTKQPRQDISPGGNRAILTLADGSKIILDSAGNGDIAKQENVKITKQDDQLIYEETNYTQGSADLSKPSLNTMTTPRGGQYRLTLPDGSKVWLNAASSITFPTSFTGKERNVSITGEAYLEVIKNADLPFIVTVYHADPNMRPQNNTSVGEMKIKVLGTHFNVNAYGDEKSINTTLLEGSVRISKGEKIQLLAPEQQARVSVGPDIITLVKHADIEKTVAWKNGFFQFSSNSLLSIMKQAERWYDIEVVYEGDIASELISGELPRNVPLSQFIEMFSYTGIHFNIQGKKMIISP